MPNVKGGLLAASLLLLLAVHRADAQSELLEVTPLETFREPWGKATAVAFSHRGAIAALGTASGRLLVYDLSRRERRWTVTAPGGNVRALAFFPNDSLVAIGSANGAVAVLDLTSGQLRPLGQRRGVTAIAVSPTNATIAAATEEKDIVLWTAARGPFLARLRDAHAKPIRHIAFAGRGETLVSVGEDRRIVYWDIQRQTALRAVQHTQGDVVAGTASPSGDLLLLGSEEAHITGRGIDPMRDRRYTNLLTVYRTETAAPQKTIDLEGRLPAMLAMSADCKYVGAALRDVRGSTFAMYDVARGVAVVNLPAAGRLEVAALSRDGRFAILGADDGSWFVYSVRGISPRPSCVGDLRGTKFAVTGPSVPLVRPARRVRFAVMDLDDNGVGSEIARAVTDQLSNRLAANPAVRLVERRRIATIMREQEFQHSGRTDPTTAAHLARIFNVQKMVLGSVSRLGTTMTITVQLVDVETAHVDGSREIQCRSCEVEELAEAMAELSHTLVDEPTAEFRALPAPPRVDIEYPREDAEVDGGSLTLRARVDYTDDLEGVELIVNGRAIDASRVLSESRDGKLTRVSGIRTVALVQEVPLDQPTNVIAVRAVGGDGNDEQRILTVRRRPRPVAATTSPNASASAAPIAPTLSQRELEMALSSRVSGARLSTLVRRFGVGFALDAASEGQLRTLGATDELLAVIRSSRR